MHHALFYHLSSNMLYNYLIFAFFIKPSFCYHILFISAFHPSLSNSFFISVLHFQLLVSLYLCGSFAQLSHSLLFLCFMFRYHTLYLFLCFILRYHSLYLCFIFSVITFSYISVLHASFSHSLLIFCASHCLSRCLRLCFTQPLFCSLSSIIFHYQFSILRLLLCSTLVLLSYFVLSLPVEIPFSISP